MKMNADIRIQTTPEKAKLLIQQAQDERKKQKAG